MKSVKQKVKLGSEKNEQDRRWRQEDQAHAYARRFGLEGAPTFGGISKLLLQNSITYYPNKFLSMSKTSAFRTTIDGVVKNPHF